MEADVQQRIATGMRQQELVHDRCIARLRRGREPACALCSSVPARENLVNANRRTGSSVRSQSAADIVTDVQWPELSTIGAVVFFFVVGFIVVVVLVIEEFIIFV